MAALVGDAKVEDQKIEIGRNSGHAAGVLGLEVGVDRVAVERDRPLSRLGQEHDRAVEVLQKVAETDIDVGRGISQRGCAVERDGPQVWRYSELPSIILLIRRRARGRRAQDAKQET